MSKDLHIGTTTGGKAFSLPTELITRTQAILAIKGAGKTYSGLVQMEEMLQALASHHDGSMTRRQLGEAADER